MQIVIDYAPHKTIKDIRTLCHTHKHRDPHMVQVFYDSCAIINFVALAIFDPQAGPLFGSLFLFFFCCAYFWEIQ